jgi:hypothetical protein
MNRKLKLLIAFVGSSALVGGVAAAASSPSVSTSSSTSIKTSSAVLRGIVDPNGSSTIYQFEWGLAKDVYGAPSAAKSAGRGTAAKAVEFTAKDLTPGTPYHYRLLASNRFGTTMGADRTFKTAGHPPPDAITGGVTQLTANSATITGLVNPHGQITTYYFQYGTTTAYGMQTFPAVVAAGSVPVPVAQSLTGLAALASFHFRLVALHGSVPGFGLDQSFLTYPSPRPVPRVPARTTPRQDHSRPFVFTTSGRVIGPSNIPESLRCFQNVTVRFLLGRRQVGFNLLPVLPNCTFSGQTVFQHLPGRGKHRHLARLRVLIHFRGNGYLAPSDAKPESIVLGKS